MIDSSIVKKNSYDFSAVKEVLKETNNNDFKTGESDFYSLTEGYLSVDTSKSYIWTAMSAVTDDVMESIYQNVLNYIDNVSNIDTCSVKALQSMVQILGTKFSVFDNLANCPVEILNLVDVFSIRKDYLLKSDKVCQRLVNAISSESNLSSISPFNLPEDRDKLTYLLIDKLDNEISSTFYNVLLTHVTREYGSMTQQDPIYEALSDTILNNGFVIPNKYDNTIKNYKIKWNIDSSFDHEEEADKIDNGLSTMSDYTWREQNILKYEFQRRNEAKYKLEPRSRFAYYKEKDVKDYFSFIEQTYNDLLSVYTASMPYDIDQSYIEIKALSSATPLLVNYGGVPRIQYWMIESVAQRLTSIVQQIRDTREYLKSHAQRTYMKGTFLLLEYIVKEYLRNNVYNILPTLGYTNTNFNSEENVLELVEYIDQTQYNNIFTDIEEDKNDKTLNPEYWKGVGSNGSAIGLDSANIFKPADKLKLVTTSTFTKQELTDFYLNVLNNQTGLRREKESDWKNLQEFLSAVFKIGADNSYRTTSGKVMCELMNTTVTDNPAEWYNNRKFTRDIDKYIEKLQTTFSSCSYLLNGYQPMPNITYQQQISEIKNNYDGKLYTTFTSLWQTKNAELQQIIDKCNEIIEELNEMNVLFIDINTSFSNLVISQMPNTGNFQLYNDIPFIDNIEQYNGFVLNLEIPQQAAIIQQIDSLKKQYIVIEDRAKALLNEKICTKITYKSTSFDSYQLTANFKILTGDLTNVGDYCYGIHLIALNSFENIYKYVSDDLLKLKNNLQQQLTQTATDVQLAIINFINYNKYSELEQLSTLLSAFLLDQNNIYSCVYDISAKLDYTQTDQYKYKEKLFNKYTGLSTSDIPFYYVENVKHPSYQIHPCLENFIEYVDYSFPLKNLANLAEKTISDIATTTTSLCIDNSGYLLSAWNNPLNGNEDYMTRYEKSSHIDERGETNQYYGFDGLFHWKYKNDIGDSVINNLINGNDEGTPYEGLNLSKSEKNSIGKKLAELYEVLYSKFKNKTSGNNIKILRYAHDIFGNSYILLAANKNDKYGTLWFRPKNYPLAFPALLYKNSEFRQDLSEFDLTYPNSNQYFHELKRIQLFNTAYFTPAFADFIFATDKTTLLLNGFDNSIQQSNLDYAHSFPVIANIVQDYQHDPDKQYFIRTFAKDQTNASLEHLKSLDSNLTAAIYYIEGRHVGQIYSHVEGTNLTAAVYKYNQDNVNAQNYTSAYMSGIFDNLLSSQSEDIKFSCRSDGIFSIAYIGNNELTLENRNVQTYTGTKLDNYNSLTTSIDTFAYPIVTHDFQTCDITNTILSINTDIYAPYVDMGFIWLPPISKTSTSKSWDLSSTTFEEDFKDKKVLKFAIDKKLDSILTASMNLGDTSIHGIDFKYICPMRVEELEKNHTNSDTTLHVNDEYSNVAFQRNYAKGSLGNTKLKHYAITDMHVFDSEYNMYVLSGNIPEFLDLVEYEQMLFDQEGNSTGNSSFAEYVSLVNYDVARYLSVQYKEVGDIDYYVNDSVKYQSDINEIEMITEPFLVSKDQFERLYNSGTGTYFTGYALDNTNNAANKNIGSYRIVLAENIDLSVEVMKNDYGTIKLDFNPIYYFRKTDNWYGLNSNTNIRNKMHIFLNLDKPGDSGYLNIYKKINSNNISIDPNHPDLLTTLFIKNISTSEPKFLIKAIYFDPVVMGEDVDQKYTTIIADKETHMFRSSEKQESTEYMLVDESIASIPIEFE